MAAYLIKNGKKNLITQADVMRKPTEECSLSNLNVYTRSPQDPDKAKIRFGFFCKDELFEEQKLLPEANLITSAMQCTTYQPHAPPLHLKMNFLHVLFVTVTLYKEVNKSYYLDMTINLKRTPSMRFEGWKKNFDESGRLFYSSFFCDTLSPEPEQE